MSKPQTARSDSYTVAMLDFDGVIAVNQPLRGPRLSAFDRIVPERVMHLNVLVARAGCRVVVSSSWRFNPKTGEGMRAVTLESILRQRGYTGSIHGITPCLAPEARTESDIANGRGAEILAWCAEQPVKPRAIVVLDDVRLTGPVSTFQVQTDEAVGLTEADVERSVALLTKPWTVQRHSGRRDGTWREAARGPETRARARYASIREQLRQGGVRLVAPHGVTIESTGAPMLRTRW